MRIQTRGNSNTVWLSSEAGVINGTMTLSVTPLEKILQAVNEKYGTSFEGWSQLPTAYEVGDTVPNWNAYEKIEMPSQKIAAKAGSWEQGNSYIIGTLTGDNFEIISDELNSCLVDENGVIVGYSGPPARYPDAVKAILQSVGINAGTITEKVVSWEVGSTIENWSEYTKYS